MKEHIQKQIKRIEQERGIKILLACETGSRAWGFPSPDSDYDVRMIYVQSLDWYLRLNEGKDTIEIMIEEGDLDITGWELRKALRLMKKSNAALLERLQSPIVYQSSDELAELRAFGDACYSRIATIHHYMNHAKASLRDLDKSGQYKLKKMFYALRAATACDWILSHDEKPPIVYQELMEGSSLSLKLKGKIHELIGFKSEQSEGYLHNGELEIFEYIEEQLKFAGENGNEMPAGENMAGAMDDFFRKTIKSFEI